MTKLKFLSLNCRGMALKSKREDLFRKWKDEGYDLILLQDTHWTPETIIQVREEWDNKNINSTYTSKSRGCSILINNTFEYTLGKIVKDDLGNYVLVEILLPNETSIVIGSIYGPNIDNADFYHKLDEIISHFNNPNIILGGDWNSTRNFKLDNNNYISQNNLKSTQAISNLMTKHNLIDIWRAKNPSKKRYTWLQGISKKQARLDYYLCNEELLSISSKEDILYKYRSDHAPIIITISLQDQPRGPGSWKLNNSLLKEDKFITMIKKEIMNFKLIHAATPYNQDYVMAKNSDIEFLNDPIIFWESLMATLRGSIISYSIEKGREKKSRFKKLEETVKALDLKVTSGKASTQDFVQLKEHNITMIYLRQEELKGAFIRSRAEWHELGEKPSRYFLNLENKNRINKTINEIKMDDNTIINDQQRILSELREFYAKLYSNKKMNEESDYIPTLNPTELSPEQKQALEQDITRKELDVAVKSLKNNKAPGPDGFSPEFYKLFWPQLEHYFRDYVNESHKTGSLTKNILSGVITCLPKSGKARNLIKNWRPISLLNTSYKIISTCITNRLRPLLKSIISPEQKGFLEDRSINDCTRLMCDIINECDNRSIKGLILLIDFEKAFDSISWSFINSTLRKMNFGDSFIKWITMFQMGSTSKITLNGHYSQSFPLQRGCRQGDPISPYLFILCSELLTLAIKNDRNLEGIKTLQKEHKLCQYADDTSVFLKSSERNLKLCLRILHWFYVVSGLKINLKKTKVIRIGDIRETDRRYCKENNLDWVSTFVSLGISYDIRNMADITQYNINEKLPQMTQLISAWSKRILTPAGRITVLKSLIISKITHILISLPSPTEEMLTKLEKLCTDFIWNGKRHEVSKTVLCKEIKKGGLNMVNIKEFEICLKITWIRKLICGTPDWGEFAIKYHVDRLSQTEGIYHNTLLTQVKNHFWGSVIKAYSQWYEALKNNFITSIELTPLWGNPQIRIPFNSKLFNNNIRYLRDLYNGDGTRLTKIDLELKIGRRMTFLEHLSLWQGIPGYMKEEIQLKPVTYDLLLPISIQWLTKDKKGTRNLRHVFKQENRAVPKGQLKWSEELNLHVDTNWELIYARAQKCNLNARIKFFNYQILHRSLATNKKLMVFGITDNNQCDKCGITETIVHLLCECPSTNDLWRRLEQWMTINLRESVYLTNETILLGDNKISVIANYIIIVTKHEIFKSKWTKKNIQIIDIIKRLKEYLVIEEYISKTTQNIRTTLGKWSPIFNLLKRI